MNIFDKNLREIFSSEIVCLIFGSMAGIFLALFTEKILLIPGILILLPGFLEMRGNISGTFASRISSGLFLGVINPNKLKTKLIRGNLIASFILVIIVSFILGCLAYFFNLIIFDTASIKIIYLSLIAGIIANTIEITLTLLATFYIFKKGHDPNNIMGPFVSSTGDFTSIISLLIALVII